MFPENVWVDVWVDLLLHLSLWSQPVPASTVLTSTERILSPFQIVGQISMIHVNLGFE